MAKSAAGVCRRPGLLCRHFPTLYGHIEGLSQPVTGGWSVDEIRRRFRPSSSARDVVGHTSAYTSITDRGLRVCPVRLFPPRPGIKAVSGSEMPLSDRSQDMFIEERRPLAARLRTTQRALGTGELRRRQLLLPSAATGGPMAPPSLPTRGRIQRSDAVNVLRQDVQPMGYQPGHPRSWSLASIDQSQSFP